VRLFQRVQKRRVGALVGLVLMAGWMAADIVRGSGVWPAVGRYFNDLTARAGPTRDLRRTARDLVGAPARRPITLRVWDYWAPSNTEDFTRYFNELETRFEALHPDVDVVYQYIPFAYFEQKLATGMIGDRPPDVFQCSVYWAQAMYARGMLLRLNDLIARTPELQDDQFIQSALYHSRDQGNIFGITQVFGANCLMWNLDRLKAKPQLHYLFARDANGQTDFTRIRFDAVRDWEHFREIARILTDEKQGLFGYEINGYQMDSSAFMTWAAANGSMFQDHAGTKALFNTPGTVEALQFLLDLCYKDKVSPPFRQINPAYEMFQKGEVAVSLGGVWSPKHLVRNTMGWKRFGLTAFPPGSRGTKPRTLCWGNMLVIGSRCEHPEVAWDYLRFVCGPEGAKLRLTLLWEVSTRRDVYQSEEWRRMVREDPFLENIPAICASGVPLLHTQPEAVRDELVPIFEYLMLKYLDIEAGRGRYRDPAHALTVAEERVNAVYARYQRVLADWAGRGRGGGRQEGR
jgi:multiple sugar transport system substrate-binding protein